MYIIFIELCGLQKYPFMKNIFSIIILFVSIAVLGQQNLSSDSIRTYFIDEIVVTSSYKETNPLQTLPGSVSILSSSQLDGMQINNVKDISSVVPNFFIPDYGSKMTAPVYIRGIGNRSSGQATGMYVDQAPYLNKSTFDFEFEDIQRIEVLRGPQGTLFGRNSMGGIINIFTQSPFQNKKTKIGITGGNYGLFKANASSHNLINKNFGISLGGYYNHSDGFFTNEYSGRKADRTDAAGGKLRFDWKMNDSFKAYLLFNYDYTDQGAFPYGAYNPATGETAPVNINDPSNYMRNLFNNTLNLEYKNEHILLSSTTSFQYLDDNMNMDQDFSPEPVFTLNQKQNQQTISQEFSIKSNDKKNYQWSFGIYGFYDHLTTNALVEMKEGGIEIIDNVFRSLKQMYPSMPTITVSDDEVPLPGEYATPSMGGAIFHQSTYNHLFIDGLSITAGIRLDYEKDELNYDSNSKMDLSVRPTMPPITIPMALDTTLQGSQSMHFTEILPKVSLKYAFNKKNYVYASAAKGYNPGGYNVQIFSKLSENALMYQAMAKARLNPPAQSITIEDAAYDPEYSWNYEVGFKGEIIKGILSTSVALFYIDVDDMQLTKFVEGGEGRMLANVGNAVSKGFEIELNAKLATGLYAGINYGYTHATFKNYDDGENNYNGKYLPYAPQQTLSISGSYVKKFNHKWIDKFNCFAQYKGAGKIYWTEANDISQDFYGLLDMKAGVSKGIFSVNIWTKNLLNTNYNAFYFESMGNAFFQKGKPLTIGGDLVLTF